MNLPSSVENLGKADFSGCSALSIISISSNLRLVWIG
jgi:hypothetical protein